MTDHSKIKVGFVGFGEVNSPRDLIEQKCAAAMPGAARPRPGCHRHRAGQR